MVDLTFTTTWRVRLVWKRWPVERGLCSICNLWLRRLAAQHKFVSSWVSQLPFVLAKPSRAVGVYTLAYNIGKICELVFDSLGYWGCYQLRFWSQWKGWFEWLSAPQGQSSHFSSGHSVNPGWKVEAVAFHQSHWNAKAGAIVFNECSTGQFRVVWL